MFSPVWFNFVCLLAILGLMVFVMLGIVVGIFAIFFDNDREKIYRAMLLIILPVLIANGLFYITKFTTQEYCSSCTAECQKLSED